MAHVNVDIGHFCIGHRLPESVYSGKCNRLHGHNYQVSLDLEGPIRPTGFVVDFAYVKDLKKVIDDRFDHRTVLWKDDPLVPLLRSALQTQFDFHFITLDVVPTAENLAQHWYNIIGEKMYADDRFKNVKLSYVKVFETPSTAAFGEA